jgi:YidC/Oxa1 family membrane protein insertase
MDRSSVLRWLFIGLLAIAFWKWGPQLLGSKSGSEQALPVETYINAPDFIPDAVDPPGETNKPWQPPEGELCTIKGNRFEAELSSRGASLRHLLLTDPKYAQSEAHDVSTTPDHERWRSLRMSFRGEGGDDQLKYDRFVWKLERLGEKGCKFTYTDADVAIEKTVTAGERPFELEVATALKNLADGPKKHRTSIEAFAFRRNSEIKGNLGRVSPFQTDLSCAGKDVVRKMKDEFKEGWFHQPNADRYAAVANYYFAQAIVPVEGDVPECKLLAEDWLSRGQSPSDDNAAAIYHAKLVYPPKTLGPGERATYKQIAFFGPKERDVLAKAAGGKKLDDVINLGFFSPVAKILVSMLVLLHDKVTFKNWGLAVIALTVCLRILVFPLTWKSIQVSLGMRRLKPEIDAINAKFEGDAQQKNLAMMELYRKHGVNPLSGCLPQLVQMPIWLAMWTTLQTAVEMYKTQFLWFADLSAPDKFFILPLLLGALMIVQQRLVPQQGMDPVQQKMMTYMIPAVFTFMMLFLPAALAIYSLTNSLLAIVQQLVVEYIAPRKGGTKGEIVVTPVNDRPADPAASLIAGKGKARV